MLCGDLGLPGKLSCRRIGYGNAVSGLGVFQSGRKTGEPLKFWATGLPGKAVY